MRASDMDREGVVTILREAYTEGRLTLDEFDERTSAAYTARTWGDLLGLTADLPTQPVFGSGNPGSLGTLGTRPELPRLAPPGPEALPPLMRPSARPARRRPDGRLLPVIFIWAVIAMGAHNPVIASLLVVFFAALLIIRLSHRGH
jgi:hypothetical protein